MYPLIFVFSYVALYIIIRSQIINFNITYFLFNLLLLSNVFYNSDFALYEGLLLVAVIQIVLISIVILALKYIIYKKEEDKKISDIFPFVNRNE